MSHKGNDAYNEQMNEHAVAALADITIMLKMVRDHETYVSKKDLVGALLDGLGSESVEIADAIIEEYGNRQNERADPC